MVARLRSIAEELRGLDDGVRAEELEGRVKAARQEAGRALRDRLDLYGDDGGTIRLGRHRFAVNTRPIELTLVPHRDTVAFAITGTDYRAPVQDEGFAATRPLWNQTLVSETAETYRAEYLATSILATSPLDDLFAASADGRLLGLVRDAAADRYDEGYERGVHDHDAARILEALLRLRADAGLLRYPGPARATAQLFWTHGPDETERGMWTARARSLVRARQAFGRADALADLTAELTASITEFTERHDLRLPDPLTAEYLIEELAAAPDGFVTSQGARALLSRPPATSWPKPGWPPTWRPARPATKRTSPRPWRRSCARPPATTPPPR